MPSPKLHIEPMTVEEARALEAFADSPVQPRFAVDVEAIKSARGKLRAALNSRPEQEGPKGCTREQLEGDTRVPQQQKQCGGSGHASPEAEGGTDSAYTSLCHELARLLGPVQPRMGSTTNDQLIAKVGELLAERDELKATSPKPTLERLAGELEEKAAQEDRHAKRARILDGPTARREIAQLLRKEAEGLGKPKLEEWCERCDGQGDGSVPTTVGAEHGEAVTKCPDCLGGGVVYRPRPGRASERTTCPACGCNSAALDTKGEEGR